MMCISSIIYNLFIKPFIKYKLTLKLRVIENNDNDKYIINKISWIKNKNTIQIFRLTKRNVIFTQMTFYTTTHSPVFNISYNVS